jgi:hypothetical protein
MMRDWSPEAIEMWEQAQREAAEYFQRQNREAAREIVSRMTRKECERLNSA